MKRLLIPLGAILLLGVVGVLARPQLPSVSPRKVARSPATAPEILQAVETVPPLVTAKSASKAKPRIWPPEERPLNVASRGDRPAIGRVEPSPQPLTREKTNAAEDRPLPLEDMKEVASWKKEEPETPQRIQSLLMDPDRPSALKLLAFEKLRALGPDVAAPLIVEFVLAQDSTRGDAYLKPTVVGMLADFGHPAADRALAQIAASSREPSIQSTLLALSTRPRIAAPANPTAPGGIR